MLDKVSLLAECRRVAQDTMWNTPNPVGLQDINTADEIEKVVSAYYEYAQKLAQNLEDVESDPNLVIRAVNYLAKRAIPPMRDDMRWFEEGLSTIVELACPQITGGEHLYEPIHDDILFAIALSRRKN